MLRPSYADLMDVLNKSNQKEHHPMINSRYSVVIAAAKRARQLIDGSKSPIADEIKKPLSTAIQELYEGHVQVIIKDK
ncbi:MAG: DNA-directed RNA polymerase subunit omega [Epulopiscium sp.]|mgnify:CR=1 FL=1|nr:DNA-directed RNA polymerase subunit omega [Candidatus Epulonipiscium sp.]